MSAIRGVLARVAALVRGHRRADAELRAEMEAHLQMEIAEHVRRGVPPAEARRRALAASGGLTQAAERVREQRGLPWIEGTAADVRYAVRHFRRTPLSTVTMVLVLSLGIGTNVVLFTVLNSIATMPAPGIVRDGALVHVRGTMRLAEMGGVDGRLLSWPEVQEYAGRTELFDGVAAHAGEIALVHTGDAAATPATVSLIYTTPNYFDLLGVRPVLGTTPVAEPDVTRLTTSPTAVISHGMWQQRFGGAPDVIGRTVRVNDFPVEIVGVAPPRFLGTDRAAAGRSAIWVPLAAYPLLQKRTTATFSSRDSLFLSAVARLRPGVTPEAATSVVAGLAQRAFHAGRDGGTPQGPGGDLVPARGATGSADVVPMLASNSRVSQRSDLIVSAAASGGFALLALLITCTNVSALMVGLAVARRREIGVRLSLGAPRRRLVRQLLTESVLLSLAAAAIGLLVTAVGIRVAGSMLEDAQLVVDWRVTAATCAIAVATGILFGLSPALHATRVSVGEVLKSSSSAVAAKPSRMQRALVVAQITLTQPLLVALGVVVATTITGLNGRAAAGAPDRIVEIELDTWASRASAAERAARIAAVVERVAAMPGVVVAMPMEMGTVTAPLAAHPADRVPGVTDGRVMEAQLLVAPRGYFDAFDIPIVRGRDFEAGEHAHAPEDDSPTSIDVVIVGSDLARRLWGDANPLGRRLTMAPSNPAASAMVVVGVVDETAAGPSEVNDQVRVYVPYATMNTGVVARTAGPALPMLDAMRRTVAAEAPQMPILRAQTVEQREAETRRAVLRTSSAVAGGGLLALLLSAIGLYAVVSLAVGQRTREIGIRSALGAPRGRVVRMFFVQGLALSAFGLVLGLPLSVIATRLVADRLNWPLATSPLVGVAIGAVVLVVASVAVWIPARRASTIDPILALRTE
jgi:predicted permease